MLNDGVGIQAPIHVASGFIESSSHRVQQIIPLYHVQSVGVVVRPTLEAYLELLSIA